MICFRRAWCRRWRQTFSTRWTHFNSVFSLVVQTGEWFIRNQQRSHDVVHEALRTRSAAASLAQCSIWRKRTFCETRGHTVFLGRSRQSFTWEVRHRQNRRPNRNGNAKLPTVDSYGDNSICLTSVQWGFTSQPGLHRVHPLRYFRRRPARFYPEEHVFLLDNQ